MDIVLIPRAACDEVPADLAVTALGYSGTTAPLVLRLRRRLGLATPVDLLAAKLGLPLGDPRLADVTACWLRPGMYVARPEWEPLLDSLPGLRWLYAQSAGTDALPLDLLAARGVRVSSAPDLSTQAVAEMALACLVADAKRLPAHHDLQRQRRWRALDNTRFGDLTVGVVGGGRIGGELARLCRALGMRTVGIDQDPDRLAGGPWDSIHAAGDGLTAALAEVDALVLAVPLTPATRGLIGARELSALRPGAVLVNVARAAVVDQAAVLAALRSGRLGRAWLDLTSPLPLPRFHSLRRAPNLHLTHYSAAQWRGRQAEAGRRFWAGVRALLSGGEPADLVGERAD